MVAVVGVDGGAHKTHAIAIRSDGTLLGVGRGGCANWEVVGLDGVAATLQEAVGLALDSASLDGPEVAASVFGLGGIDWPSDVPRVDPVVANLGLDGERLLVNDAFVALRAGTPNPFGVVVIAGSGTTVAGRNRHADTYRSLGQSPPRFDDYGSATDISESAIRAIAQEYTGRGPQTRLTEAICGFTGFGTAAELLEAISRAAIPTPQVAPLVLAEAEKGDAAAIAIVRDAGRALGESAAVAIHKLDMDEETFDVVLSGGLIRGMTPLLEGELYPPIREAAPHATIVHLDFPPVVGAGLLALELLGERPDDGLRRALGAECLTALDLASEPHHAKR